MKQGKEADTLVEIHVRPLKKSNQPTSGQFSTLMLNMTDFTSDGANKYVKKLAKRIRKLNAKIES